MNQPAPKKGETDIWPLVQEDLRERVKLGLTRYGVVLQTNNGRDALIDAYEEALDLVMYLRQLIEERETSSGNSPTIHAWRNRG